MSSQHAPTANAPTFIPCGRAACPRKGTQFAVQEMKLIRYGDKERRFICRACYEYYMERSTLQQTGVRGRKFGYAAGIMHSFNVSLGTNSNVGTPAVESLFPPTEALSVIPTLENPVDVQGNHRKRVHEEVSRGYRGSKSLDMKGITAHLLLIAFRESRAHYGYAT